jgi:hypothetical protein
LVLLQKAAASDAVAMTKKLIGPICPNHQEENAP